MTALYLCIAFGVVALFLWCVVFAPWIVLAWFAAGCLLIPLAGRRLRKLSA